MRPAILRSGMLAVVTAGMLLAVTICGCSPTAGPGSGHRAAAGFQAGGARGTIPLQSVQMLTATTGWAVGGGPNQAAEILVRTTDGGHIWRDAGPAALHGAFFWNASFYSTRDVWLTLLRANLTRPVIYHTIDAGRTWRRTGTAGDHATYASAPDMLGRLGWITASWDYGMLKESLAILRTADGGRTWQMAELSTPVRQTPGALPGECGKNDAVFPAPAAGWITGSCLGGPPPFWRTRDGGRTWHYVSLPSPWRPRRLAGCECMLAGPAFTSARTGVIWGLAGPGTDSLAGVAWLTRDSGWTWQLVRLPAGLQPVGSPDLVGSRQGYVLAGRLGPEGGPARRVRLLATSDGGITWRLRPASGLSTTAILDFVTPLTGFALVPGARYLLRTTNGGITWTVIPARSLSSASS